MIFAAGLGTRLMPHTATKPKALVEVNGVSMLEIVIKRIIDAGFYDIVINVHHFANQIEDFIRKNNGFGANVLFSDERDLLLDTGGGLLKAAHLFKDTNAVLLHNVDVVSSINLKKLYDDHLKSGDLASLSCHNRSTSRSLLVDSEGFLSGWKNNQSGETIISRNAPDYIPTAFDGIHVVSTSIFPFISETGVFSITPMYLRLAKEQRIRCRIDLQSDWTDLSKLV